MNYTHTPVAISPLIEERSYYLLKAGMGFLYSNTLKEDREFMPRKYVSSYKPFSLYEESPSNPVAKEFIKKGGVYFPEEDWDTYISLVGSSLLDISFVLENFPNKKLVLNHPYDRELYNILTSIRDYPENFIEVYEKLVSSLHSITNNREANCHYKNIKQYYYECLGHKPVFVSSAILLFLLHTGGFYTPFFGVEGISFYKNRIETLWQWHKVLSSPLVSLYSTTDYSSLQLPTKGRNFIVSNCPECYTATRHTGWNQPQTKVFTQYYTSLKEQTDSFLLATANTNPNWRSQFDKKKGWSFYKVIDNTPISPLYYEVKKHKNNTNRCVVSNFPLQLSTPELTPHNQRYTTEYLNLYKEYCSSLI